MRTWGEWTEAAINKRLEGRFYQLQQKSLGSYTVVDLNEPEPEPEEQPAAPVVIPAPLNERRRDGSLWLDNISRAVCEMYGVTRIELSSARRAKHLVEARQVLFWIARRYTAHGYPFIGDWCGRDHTTVLYAVGKIDARFEEYREKIEKCLSRLGVSLNEKEAA